ncbi:MAG: hypothetical protein JKY65_26315 [Planctomycetes bacterium]|nr:hypothetical protein [Planctomycetota bacterium]
MRAPSALLALGACLALTCPGLAQEKPVPDPWGLARIASTSRTEIERVRQDATVSCALKARPVHSTEEVYRYLLTRLPLASRWLAALDLGDYGLTDLPNQRFQIDDKAGAKAEGERVLSEPGRLVVIARGTLEVPLLPKIRGVGVILIRFPQATATKTGQGPAPLVCSAKVAFRVKGRLFHGIGRALQRILRRVLRSKLDALVTSATALAESITRDPTGTYLRLKQAKASAEDLRAFRARFLAL